MHGVFQGKIGWTKLPLASSPPLPTHAPVRKDGTGSVAPAPILLWNLGPTAPKDLGNIARDAVGWCFDAHGYWWEVFPPTHESTRGGGFGVLPESYTSGENGYLFAVRTGPPVTSDGGLFAQMGQFVEKVIAPIALSILTIIQPEIGIAASIVYADVVKVASGARLTDAVFNGLADAAKAQIPSATGRDLFDLGTSAALSSDALKKARARVSELSSAGVADLLGLKKAFETGVTYSQTQAIQTRALQILRSELKPVPWATQGWFDGGYAGGTYDAAVSQNVSPTDLAAGMFPTVAEGLARWTNALGQATKEINPKAASAVHPVIVPASPAQSASSVSSKAPGLGTVTAALRSKVAGKGSQSSSGPGAGTVLVTAGLAYLGYRIFERVRHHG